jgi:hypothetical protein
MTSKEISVDRARDMEEDIAQIAEFLECSKGEAADWQTVDVILLRLRSAIVVARDALHARLDRKPVAEPVKGAAPRDGAGTIRRGGER